MNLKHLFKKDPMAEHWNPLHMGNYGVSQAARDASDELTKGKLLRVLLECFPSWKTLDGGKRMKEFALIIKHFNIVHWKVRGDYNNGKYFNPNYPVKIAKSYLIVKFDNVKLRGAHVQNFGTIYCVLTAKESSESPLPRMKFENLELNHFGYQNPDRGRTKPDLWWKEGRHPHISNGEPCLGAFDNMLYKSAAQGSVLQFLELIKSFLFTWNRHSAYFNMNRFIPLRDREGKLLMSGIQVDKLGILAGSTREITDYKSALPALARNSNNETELVFALKVLIQVGYKVDTLMGRFSTSGYTEYGLGTRLNPTKTAFYPGLAKYSGINQRLCNLHNRSWEYYGYRINELDSDVTMTHPSHSEITGSLRKDGKQSMQWCLSKLKRYRNLLSSFLMHDPNHHYWDIGHRESARPASVFKSCYMNWINKDDGKALNELISMTREKNVTKNEVYLIDSLVGAIIDLMVEEIFPKTVEEWDSMFKAYTRDSKNNNHPLGPDAFNFEWLELALMEMKTVCGESKVNSLKEYIKEIQDEIDTFKNDSTENRVLSGQISF